MSEETSQNKHSGISRRDFLKDAGLVVGGAAISSMAFLNACKSTTTVTVTAGQSTTTSGSGPVPVNTSDWASTPGGKLLVSAQWVNAVISGKAADTYTNNKYMIFEASWGDSSDAYAAGHLPGAVHFNTDNIETEANFWNIGPIDHVTATLNANGVTSDKTVIVYANTGGDLIGASRVVVALMWAGVKDVRLMDGSLVTWKAAGFATETKVNNPVPVTSLGVTIPQHPELLLVTPQDVIKAQKDSNFRLCSNRSWDEFIGKISGYDYIPRAGEPKGAVWVRDSNGGGLDDIYLNADGSFKPFAGIEPIWADWGVTKDTVNSFYCGTGWRATVPFLMAYMQGWKNVTLYDGGWYMWQMDATLPIQKWGPFYPGA